MSNYLTFMHSWSSHFEDVVFKDGGINQQHTSDI